MLKRIATYRPITIITCILTILNMMFYFSMRCIWTGIGKFLNGNQDIPNYLMIGFVALVVIAWLLAWLRIDRIAIWFVFGISVILDVALFFIIKIGAWDYLLFILEEFKDAILFGLGIVAIVWIIFYYSSSKLAKMEFLKLIILGLIIILSVSFALGLGINRLKLYPTVYAVEDDYQVVFTTSTDATVWVKVGDDVYYDTYAGSQKSEQKVHKVIIPMDKLNESKNYQINIQQILMRGPYGAFKGQEKSYSFNFKPVDTTDGFKYYTLSDAHGKGKAAIKVASYYGDDLDLLLLLGDISSFLEKEKNIELIGKVAYGITKGEIPVVYARGNHETKGTLADQLYKYVGSNNEKFYFTFTLGEIFGVVLDGGEDHNDDWWEYYGLSRFEEYRNDQTEFLKDIIANKEEFYGNDKIKFKMAICHFVIPYVSKSGFLSDVKDTWTKLLNEMNVDVLYSGHEHEIFPIIPGTFTPYTDLKYSNIAYTTKKSTNEGHFTDAKFPSFVVSKHSDVQNIFESQDQLDSKLCGVANEIDKEFTTLKVSYTNRFMEKMEIVDPFSTKVYGKDIIINLK